MEQIQGLDKSFYYKELLNMLMLIDEFITEKSQEHGKTAEMQTGFRVMAKLLISNWTSRIASSSFLQYAANPYNLASGTFEDTFLHGKHLKKLPEALRQFAKNATKNHTVLRAGEAEDGTKGTYQPGIQPVITIYFDKDEFDNRIEKIREGNVWQIMEFLNTRLDVVVHELIHAYDDYTSKGRYRDPEQVRNIRPYGAPPLTDAEKQARHEKYLQYSHEINARFGQTVSKMYVTQFNTWKDFAYDFKTHFYGWTLMSPEVKKRLLIRLGSIWSAEQRKKSIDINPFIKKLNDRLRETDPNIWITPDHGDIEIRDLDELSPKIQSFVLRQVTRLADIFQRQVVTSNNIPILKGFDFVQNKGRNKDYRKLARFRRPAKIRS